VRSLAVDVALMALFAIQHSVMARPAFKQWWTRVIPPFLERAVYVLASLAALALLAWQWRPLGGIVWDVQEGWARALLHIVGAAGWLIALWSALSIDGLELIGLRQLWAHRRGMPPAPAPFVTPGFYRVVRHPLYLGFLVAFWSAPTMSLTHLVLALGATAYILIGIQLEERDLSAVHPEYAAYRRRVPMLIPGVGARRRATAEVPRG